MGQRLASAGESWRKAPERGLEWEKRKEETSQSRLCRASSPWEGEPIKRRDVGIVSYRLTPARERPKKILKTVGTKIQGQRLISDDGKMQQTVTEKY